MITKLLIASFILTSITNFLEAMNQGIRPSLFKGTSADVNVSWHYKYAWRPQWLFTTALVHVTDWYHLMQFTRTCIFGLLFLDVSSWIIYGPPLHYILPQHIEYLADKGISLSVTILSEVYLIHALTNSFNQKLIFMTKPQGPDMNIIDRIFYRLGHILYPFTAMKAIVTISLAFGLWVLISVSVSADPLFQAYPNFIMQREAAAIILFGMFFSVIIFSLTRNKRNWNDNTILWWD